MNIRHRLETLTEPIIEWIIRLCGISAIIFVFGIFFFVFREGSHILFRGFDLGKFFTSPEWYPDSLTHKRYGTLALIAGTGSVTVLAMAIAVPFGLGAAIFVSEFCWLPFLPLSGDSSGSL
jgi:phosphate transport system permease protein